MTRLENKIIEIQLEEIKNEWKKTKTFINTQIRKALFSFEEGDYDKMVSILKAIIGENIEEEYFGTICPECNSNQLEETSSGSIDDEKMGGISWVNYRCKECNHYFTDI